VAPEFGACPRFPALALILCLAYSIWLPTQANASEASDLYKSGKSALEEGRPEQAVAHLELACRLAPDKEKYQEKLEEARQAAADALISQATSASKLVEQLPFLDRATVFAPNNPRVRAFRAGADERLRGLTDRVLSAQSRLDQGDRELAVMLMDRMEGLEPWIPELTELGRAMSLSVGLSSLEAAINSDLDLAVERLELWHNRFDEADEERLDASVFRAIAPFLEELHAGLRSEDYEPSSRDGRLLDLAIRSCSSAECERAAEVAQSVLAHVLSPSEIELLKSRSDDPIEELGRCYVLNRVANLSGPVASSQMVSPCEFTARPPVRISWVVVPDDSCRNLVVDSLSSSIAADLRSTGKDGWDVPIVVESEEPELEVALLLANCRTAVIEQRDLTVKSSEYTAGVQQLANPQYQITLNNLQQAQIALASVPASCACIGTCTPLVLSICRSTKQIIVGRLQRQLQSIPPYTQRPVRMPYRYEEFEVAGDASIAAGVVLKRPSVDAYLSFESLEGQSTFAERATRGVLPNDAHGLNEHEPPDIDRAALLASALVDLQPDIQSAIRSKLSDWFFYSASVAKHEGRRLEAIGQLARAVIDAGNVPAIEAWRLLEGTPPAVGAALEALPHPEDLETRFDDVLASVPTSSAQPAQAAAEDVVDRALSATVVVNGASTQGSGFFVTSTGLIVTNWHVVESDDTVEVVTRAGDRFLGRIIRRFPEQDLALIQIDASEMPFLEFARAAAVRIGSDVFAVGSPEGFDGSVSSGIVSAIRTMEGVGTVVQTDAAINHGNSGGPLVNRQGLVVGVNSWKWSSAEGVGFALSSDVVQQVFREQLGPWQ
jgi:S1-C subfamily serine protease